jgi:hypothetical protein
VAKTLEQVTAKYSQNASAAQTAYTDGIQNTSVDPTALAAAKQAEYLAGVQASANLWRSRLLAVGKQGWQSASVAKAGNYGTGIQAGLSKYQSSMQTWLPRIQAAGAAAKQMPGSTLQQRIARSAYVATQLYNAKRGL